MSARQGRLSWPVFILVVSVLIGVPLTIRAWYVSGGNAGLTSAIVVGWIAVWMGVVLVARMTRPQR
jgi:hypothetical protein